MKTQFRTLTLVAGLLCAASGFAQPTAPATAPATKAPAAAPMTMPAPATAAMPAPAASKAPAPATKAAGGGAGKVWVNTQSHVYHCEGSKSYGKTKSGEYMTEAAAKTKGNRPDHGKSCNM